MEYLEAVKEVRTKKIKENYMVISFSYYSKIVMPYKDGLAFLAAFVNAEEIKDSQKIIPVTGDTFTSKVLSAEEYEQYKIAALLNISIEEVKEFALKAT